MAFVLRVTSLLVVALLARASSISSAHVPSSRGPNVAVRLAAVPAAPVFQDECLRDGDCPLTHFCKIPPRNPYQRPWCGLNTCSLNRCVPLFDVGRFCGGSAAACPAGLFCLGTVADPRPRCTPQKPWGGVCWMGLAGNCARGLACVRTKGNWGTCAPIWGKPKRRIGQLCGQNYDCSGGLDLRRARVPICNLEFSRHITKFNIPAICALPGTLITKAGTPCAQGRDLCDRRRDLRCERFGAHHVCVQRSSWSGRCSRGSPFSFCSTAAAGTELECRRGQSLFTKVPRGPVRCYARKETVPVGALCVAEHTVCESGASCVHASDLKTFVSYKGSPAVTAYCMRTVPLGGDCRKRFLSKCAPGSGCVKGTCRRGVKPDVLPVLAGINGSCKSLSCARGLACDKHNNCRVRPVYAGPWARCSGLYSLLGKNIICVKGTYCTRVLEWRGIKRCRPAGGVGAFCEVDDACDGTLKCGPAATDDFLQARRCYDPRTAIPVGGVCDPKNSGCVVGFSGESTKCLPKGTKFVCQEEIPLDGSCYRSELRGTVCAPGLVCDSRGTCVPEKA